jgi:hypothetical protein
VDIFFSLPPGAAHIMSDRHQFNHFDPLYQETLPEIPVIDPFLGGNVSSPRRNVSLISAIVSSLPGSAA